MQIFCIRCGYKWTPRMAKPTVCPKCKSPNYDKERKFIPLKSIKFPTDKFGLTQEEKDTFIKWVIENINSDVIPEDEGDSKALIFNIIHRINGDKETYNYLRHQDEEMDLLLGNL